jgi:protein SCO1/2
MKMTLFILVFFVASAALAENHQHRSHHTATEQAADIKGDSIYNITSKWKTSDNKEISLIDLKGKPLVAAMVYTSCPYACPLITADIKRIEKELPKEMKNSVSYILFSFDPDRDSPKVLKAFSDKKHLNAKQWHLLTSNVQTVRELAAVLGIKYKKTAGGDFEHSNIIFVIDKDGVIRHQQVGLNQDPAATIDVLKKLIN